MDQLSARELLGPETESFYCGAMTAMQAAKVPFLVGAPMPGRYTGIVRYTKDLDLVRPADCT